MEFLATPCSWCLEQCQCAWTKMIVYAFALWSLIEQSLDILQWFHCDFFFTIAMNWSDFDQSGNTAKPKRAQFPNVGKERRTNTFPILFIYSGSALSFILFTIHHSHSGPPLLHPVSRGKLSRLNVNKKISVGRTVWCYIPLQWTILEIYCWKKGVPFYTDEKHSALNWWNWQDRRKWDGKSDWKNSDTFCHFAQSNLLKFWLTWCSFHKTLQISKKTNVHCIQHLKRTIHLPWGLCSALCRANFCSTFV